MSDDVKIGRTRLDSYQQTSPRVESVGDSPDLQYITASELERLRTRLQRAEDLLREEQKERLAQADYERTDHCPECGYDMSSEWSAQIHQRKADEIDAFLGDQP